MIISLTVMSGVMIIAGHFASRQLSVLRSMTAGQTVRGQLGEAVAITRALLRNVKPGAGDILVAQDSVLEVRVTTGIAVACASAAGVLTIPAPDTSLTSVSAFSSVPQPGDRIDALFVDSVGIDWVALRVISTAAEASPCPPFTTAGSSLIVTIDQPLSIGTMTPLQFSRPFRLSYYRSPDGRWYLGGRDWNGEEERFNTVQPLAGPLAPRSGATPGLEFVYRDANGLSLAPPVDAYRLATVAMVLRGIPAGAQPADSAFAVIAFRP